MTLMGYLKHFGDQQELIDTLWEEISRIDDKNLLITEILVNEEVEDISFLSSAYKEVRKLNRELAILLDVCEKGTNLMNSIYSGSGTNESRAMLYLLDIESRSEHKWLDDLFEKSIKLAGNSGSDLWADIYDVTSQTVSLNKLDYLTNKEVGMLLSELKGVNFTTLLCQDVLLMTMDATRDLIFTGIRNGIE